jgi:glycosyltransferase involved in cell wall biosynthesis
MRLRGVHALDPAAGFRASPAWLSPEAAVRPTVSVIIPAYEHALFVGEAIESVLAQSCGDIELLVTDDGSRDGTVEVIRRFTDPRLSLKVFEHNRGASAAINAGLRRARGEFVCFLGSDDRFLPGKLDLQLDFMRANPQISAVFGMPQFIGNDGGPIEPLQERPWYDVFRRPIDEQLRSRQDWLRRFFFLGNCLCQPTAMIRRAAFGEVGMYDQRLANLPDFDLWVRVCSRYDIHVMDRQVTAMRILDDNRNMSAPRPDSRLRHAIEYFHILKRYLHFPPELVRQVFSSEIDARVDLAREPDHRFLLAELALTVKSPPHQMFALNTMFEAALTQERYCQRLILLAGSSDPFSLTARKESLRLNKELALAKAEIVRLTRELAQTGRASLTTES